MVKSLKVALVGSECVACGTCVPVCPRSAITVKFGISAYADSDKCVGCGMCAKICPAAVISIIGRETTA